MGSDDLSEWKKGATTKNPPGSPTMVPYVHPRAHSYTTHNAPPLRIKNWLIGTNPSYAFSFLPRRPRAKRASRQSGSKGGKEMRERLCKRKKFYFSSCTRPQIFWAQSRTSQRETLIQSFTRDEKKMFRRIVLLSTAKYPYDHTYL